MPGPLSRKMTHWASVPPNGLIWPWTAIRPALPENLSGLADDVGLAGILLDHLGVSGDGAQGVLELMGDAGCQFSQRGKIFLEPHLPLHRHQLGNH